MKKSLVLIICISCMSSILLCLGCGGGVKDVSGNTGVSGKYVSPDGWILELTPDGTAISTELDAGGGMQFETGCKYQVSGNSVKLIDRGKEYYTGKEKEPIIFEIRNGDLIDRTGKRWDKQ